MMRRGFKTWSENEAIQLRHGLGLRPDSPMPARDLAQHFDVLVLQPDEVPGITIETVQSLLESNSGWSAVTVAVDGIAVIVHNTGNGIARQESDLMHELAHVICRHPAMKIVKVGGVAIREYSLVQEEEAAWLGGCLQLPRVALWSALRKGMDNASIMSRFNASEAMVQYRRNVTGVDVQLARMNRA